MKLNLGCGRDVRLDYTNVDLETSPGVFGVDLSAFPWPWENNSVEEILMLDFLEHFPYRQTEQILLEVWRVLKPNGTVEIQVPDFDHCARAAIGMVPFLCNRCGQQISETNIREISGCDRCKQSIFDIQNAAIHRLYGGQDRVGNWHYTAFTQEILVRFLKANGFGEIQMIEKTENGQTQFQNWNFKLRARKLYILWEE